MCLLRLNKIINSKNLQVQLVHLLKLPKMKVLLVYQKSFYKMSFEVMGTFYHENGTFNSLFLQISRGNFQTEIMSKGGVWTKIWTFKEIFV